MTTSPTRRQVLQAMAAAPLALSPLAVLAKPSDLLAVTRLHPVRFVGGLIFDVARAVAVNRLDSG